MSQVILARGGVDAYHGLLAPVTDFGYALALPADLHARFGGGLFDELAHAVLDASGNHKVLRPVLLLHQPPHAHIVLRAVHIADVLGMRAGGLTQYHPCEKCDER